MLSRKWAREIAAFRAWYLDWTNKAALQGPVNRNMDCLMVALLQACHLANYPADKGRHMWQFLCYL